ncbi:hypothetical protein [Pelagibacterium sp.]|uniref:hypothetical protein n=1 Tax=Pelagibacterium sp. TaxID=1967288 RepID=UPI003A8FA5B7
MILNRELQLQILQRVADAYPALVQPEDFGLDDSTADIVRNIHYLNDHGLIEGVFSQNLGGAIARPMAIKVTHRGLDFLADDGGLSAILGVVTVKLHEDTIRQLITQKLESSDLPEEERRPLLQAVRELPGEAIKHLTTKLLDLGMDNLPGAVAIIRTSLQSASGS